MRIFAKRNFRHRIEIEGEKMKYGGGRGKERDREGERICERERKDAH